MEIPRIISVDDHIVEPPDLWTDRLPARDRERAPHVVRAKGRSIIHRSAEVEFIPSDDDDATWTDIWMYEDLQSPLLSGLANVGELRDRHLIGNTMITYDDIRPGCFDQTARLADMDLNHTEAQMCFPTVPRFCGQTFLERKDKEFARRCLEVYNDWIIDEWCSGAGYGRLIPNTVIPLWDPELAAAEIRRCAAKGSHAVAFSESPSDLGLPSLHSGAWKPFFLACQETETVVNMHVGSSSRLPTTAPDAPLSISAVLLFDNLLRSMVDWLFSGVLAKFPRLKIAFTEGQVGWMPYVLERIDAYWEKGDMYDADMRERIPHPPSSYVPNRIYGCVFDDLFGMQSREQIGMSQIMFETDYPHADSTFPTSAKVAEKLAQEAGLNSHELWQFIRGNAIECYGLQRFGIDK